MGSLISFLKTQAYHKDFRRNILREACASGTWFMLASPQQNMFYGVFATPPVPKFSNRSCATSLPQVFREPRARPKTGSWANSRSHSVGDVGAPQVDPNIRKDEKNTPCTRYGSGPSGHVNHSPKCTPAMAPAIFLSSPCPQLQEHRGLLHGQSTALHSLSLAMLRDEGTPRSAMFESMITWCASENRAK